MPPDADTQTPITREGGPQAKLRTGVDVRRAARRGFLRGTTAGLASGYIQGNLAILPERDADDFHRFCALNPKPCPVIGVGARGAPTVPALGADLDLRTDLPGYRVWRDGELVDEPDDVRRWWRDDLVAFVIGCSFSFEEALLAAGIPLRHIALGCNVAMYRTNIACVPAGRFAGPMVVSMRPMRPDDAARAIEITGQVPGAHGAPVHIGAPEAIGISELAKPDYGDAIEPGPGEVPVFWACGVTPQVAIGAARPDLAITHAPGKMLVTDLVRDPLASTRIATQRVGSANRVLAVEPPPREAEQSLRHEDHHGDKNDP
ncbi:MAG: putative hydro-lyase [Alphaproteobacteria bacterium]|nr:putative hydro-lyase [Alphaproteobacteria bacterium]